MELKQIKELMAAMGRTGTKRLRFKKDDVELELERDSGAIKVYDPSLEFGDEAGISQPSQRPRMTLSPQTAGTPTVASQKETSPAQPEGPPSLFVASPMVGTFYASPSPDDPAFVKVGDRIEKDTIVCIIEAMKVMNEIKAGVSGVVAEILIESGHPVEFGAKLIRIVPNS